MKVSPQLLGFAAETVAQLCDQDANDVEQEEQVD